MDVSKTKSSFYRRLYVAYLIDSQQAGERNNAGHYEIRDWGAIDKHWIATHLQQIKTILGYP